MPEIIMSEEINTRVAEFKRVVEAVLEQEMSFDDCAALILERGIDSMLTDLLGAVDSTTLLSSFQQLGARHPAQVYRYVAETLRGGAAAQERERMRRHLGFHLPADTESKT